MSSLLEKIMITKRVSDTAGITYPLTCQINEKEQEQLRYYLHQHHASQVLEVGCGYGISSLCIAEVIARSQNPQLLTIDPQQSSIFKNIGKNNLRIEGYDFASCIEEGSEFVLPRLCTEGAKFDAIFIDGWHVFDHVLLDCFYGAKLLRQSGLLILDDGSYPGVRSCMRYLTHLPHLKLVYWNWGASLSGYCAAKIGFAINDFVIFQKVDEDNRPWNWHL